ncbi:GNAT family N-acetyltransferase [Dongshaea marina]|uniref:GNAT family N-acetyltransferase n=1 Tax=Dongshaea marina TaxID=2047966 RepID=UPI000D3EC018|nr:GNAT family N-acetyltransferase [Dongshaea marina]
MKLRKATQADYPRLIGLWESSVRATHHFLSEQDIAFFKPLILDQYFDAVELRVAEAQPGTIQGFVGVAQGNIEMLFVDPVFHGQGVGRALLEEAVDQMDARCVDVNEQNPDALHFYLHCGFTVTGRSERDGMGKPFPLLHLKLRTRT